MRTRLAVAVPAVAVCVSVGLMLASSATSAAPVAPKPKPLALGSKRSLADQARGIDSDCHSSVRISNLTPYVWTRVDLQGVYNNSYWLQPPPVTLKPGQDAVVQLDAYTKKKTIIFQNICYFGGYFTYQADTLKTREFLTMRLGGDYCQGLCINENPIYANSVWNTTKTIGRLTGGAIWALPPSQSDLTPNPEIGWTAGNSIAVGQGATAAFDFTFQTHGNYTLDASKAPPHLADLLNAMCAGAAGTKCSFTSIGGLHWGIGDLDLQTSVTSCGAQPPTGAERASAMPPADSPDWHEVSVEARRIRSVSFGGSLTGSTELNLFDVIDTEVSAKIGAEHEWSDTRTFEKTTRIYVPQNWLAAIWVSPVVGKVTGTLVVSTALASYTIANFEETASGVSKDLTTPAFNIMTYARPMTAEEYESLCPKQASAPAPASGPG